ncbi:hypothetical protein ACWEN3_44305, partial [Streptomyces sp. NPDC004561]
MMNATASGGDGTDPAPSWEDLVTAALLGTDRRPPLQVTPGRAAPVALLDGRLGVTETVLLTETDDVLPGLRGGGPHRGV